MNNKNKKYKKRANIKKMHMTVKKREMGLLNEVPT